MERNAFALLHDAEDSWWYRGRAAVVDTVLRACLKTSASGAYSLGARTLLLQSPQVLALFALRSLLGNTPPCSGSTFQTCSGHMQRSGLNILDFGAGFGGMYKLFAPYGAVFAFEPDAQARNFAQQKGYAAVYDTQEDALRHTYDIIGLFDVLEHIADDRASLQRMRAALSTSGRLILTVPAMPFLWGRHDVSHHHFRRYTRAALQKTLEDAGYAVEYMSYWNMLLFIPAVLGRIIGRSGEGSLRLPRALDTLLYAVIKIEVFLMRFVRLPFGVSLVAVARSVDRLHH